MITPAVGFVIAVNGATHRPIGGDTLSHRHLSHTEHRQGRDSQTRFIGEDFVVVLGAIGGGASDSWCCTHIEDGGRADVLVT